MQATRCGRNSVLIRFICQALNATSTFHSFHLLRSISRPPDLLDGVKRLIRAPGRPFARERRHRARPRLAPINIPRAAQLIDSCHSSLTTSTFGRAEDDDRANPRARSRPGVTAAGIAWHRVGKHVVSPSKTLIVSRHAFGAHPVDVLPDEPILAPDSQFSPSSCSSASSPNRGLTALKRSIMVPFNPLVGDTHHATAAGVDNVSTAHCPSRTGRHGPGHRRRRRRAHEHCIS